MGKKLRLVCHVADIEEKLAESVVLRGGQRGGRTLGTQEAAEALDAALMQEGEASEYKSSRRILNQQSKSSFSSSVSLSGLPLY